MPMLAVALLRRTTSLWNKVYQPLMGIDPEQHAQRAYRLALQRMVHVTQALCADHGRYKDTEGLIAARRTLLDSLDAALLDASQRCPDLSTWTWSGRSLLHHVMDVREARLVARLAPLSDLTVLDAQGRTPADRALAWNDPLLCQALGPFVFERWQAQQKAL